MELVKKVILIKADIFGATLAFGIGVLITAMNYKIAKRVLQKQPSKYAASQILKQLVQVIFLILLFVLGPYTPWDRIWLVAGGVIGITLPMFWFTYSLVKFNDSLQGKEDSVDE